LLTILGVVIGVMAVIVMLAVGKGVQSEVNDSINSIGSDLLVVFPGLQNSGRVKKPGTSSVSLTIQDAEAIAEIPEVYKVAPVISKTLQIQHRDVNSSSRINGVTPSYHTVRDWNLFSGEYLSDQDIRSRNRVVLIGTTVAEELFGDLNALEKIIRIKNIPFRVLGVLEKKGSSITGRDQDNTIFVPISTARQLLIRSRFPSSVSYLIVKVVKGDDQQYTEFQITSLLRERHRLRDDEANDFSVSNLTDIASTAATATRALTILLASIAGVSLLVGGIGIMNIMLVSVTERTREIGIRLAIGAKQSDILLQFLIEAVIICALGGLSGVILGISLSWVISYIVGITVEVTLVSIIISFLISSGIGVFFGWYPAKKASRMQPVDALRIE
jgi:putative ABC transport system permease protein